MKDSTNNGCACTPNQSIKCTVSNCAHHCKDQNYCGLNTITGLVVNGDMQVLNCKRDAVIPGLYAVGEITGGIHGTNRVGCNAVPDALTFGRIAGLAAAGK